ncbi:MAG: hypothetical protein ACI80V_001769 [Rhodothermales bacterium]|jgi:hypothetical protein
MTVHTTEPGVQVYTGNSLDGSPKGPSGCAHDRHTGFCLELALCSPQLAFARGDDGSHGQVSRDVGDGATHIQNPIDP